MKTTYLSIVAGLVFLLLAGCAENNDPAAEFGKIQIQLTDAPFPHDMVAEANVTIFKIEARQKGDDSEMEEGNEMESSSGNKYIVLMEDEIEVNLLDLTNGVTEMLVDTDIPAGSYDLIRVYAKGVNVVLNDEMSSVYDLKVPSGEQSGIKVFIKPELVITSGLSADVLLDFDVSRSFIPRGNIKNMDSFNGFNFKPVIKVSNLTTSGSLYGEVSTADGIAPGVEITVFKEGEVITTSSTDDSGGYMIMGLEAGIYDVTAELDGFNVESADGVVITSGNKTILNFELLPSP